MDVLRQIRETKEVTKDFSPEQIAMLTEIAENNPKMKLIMPTPGTESTLNGLTADDLSELLADTPLGESLPNVPQITMRAGGNPKSNKDKTKVAKILDTMPEVQITKGTRKQMVKIALAAPIEDNTGTNDKKK